MASTMNPYAYTEDLPMVETAIRTGVRLFPELPPHVARVDEIRETAQRLARRSELLKDNRFLEHPSLPAAYAFFGQFVAHDLTFSTTALRPQRGPSWADNQRTPRLDLDSVYGGGPNLRPELYAEQNPQDPQRERRLRYRFLVEERSGGKVKVADLPRTRSGRAVVADPRNDSNVLAAQLHVAFLRFHNRVLDELTKPDFSGSASLEAFREARRQTCWHYQWVVLHDFLKRIVDPARVDDLLDNGGRRSRALQSLIGWEIHDGGGLPMEFTGAAFRIGHSLLHYQYQLRDRQKPIGFHGLTGFRELDPKLRVDWDRFFVRECGDFERCRRLDRFMPDFPVESESEARTLIELDLLRGQELGLPSGQTIARALGMRSVHPGADDPLWYYVFKEAELARRGQCLGPLGGLLVAHVFVDVLRRDPDSFLIQDPNWIPTLGGDGRQFDLRSFLAYAKVV
ncbi:MAG: peroxidase family protein [Planctomycetota bacterium]